VVHQDTTPKAVAHVLVTWAPTRARMVFFVGKSQQKMGEKLLAGWVVEL
jgi:hypothetical protein